MRISDWSSDVCSSDLFLNQSVDDQKPFSAALFMEATANTTPTADEAIVQPEFKHRWSYVTQLLLARKFGEAFSLQLSPTLLHRNLVPLDKDPVNMPVLGDRKSTRLNSRH